jgi:hypothetical protein
MKKLISILAGAVLIANVFAATAAAAPPASYTLSPNSGTYTQGAAFTVQVKENGMGVNVVTAKLTYDASKLECTGVGGSSAFPNTIVASCGGGKVTISRYTAMDGDGNPTTANGEQVVGTINFKAAGTGSAAVTFDSNSQIASGGSNIWDRNTTGGTYTVNAPAAGGQGSGNGDNTNPSTPAPAPQANNTKKVASTTPAATNNGAVEGENTTEDNAATTSVTDDKKKDDTKKSDDKKDSTEAAADKKSNNNWLWFVLLAVAAAVYFVTRRRTASPEAEAKKVKEAEAAVVAAVATAKAKADKAEGKKEAVKADNKPAGKKSGNRGGKKRR